METTRCFSKEESVQHGFAFGFPQNTKKGGPHLVDFLWVSLKKRKRDPSPWCGGERRSVRPGRGVPRLLARAEGGGPHKAKGGPALSGPQEVGGKGRKSPQSVERLVGVLKGKGQPFWEVPCFEASPRP